jgi:hypothetical protein
MGHEPTVRRRRGMRMRALSGAKPPALRAIQHRPDPEERPKGVELEEAYLTRRVNCVTMRMIPVLCDFIRHVVNCDNQAKQGRDHEK